MFLADLTTFITEEAFLPKFSRTHHVGVASLFPISEPLHMGNCYVNIKMDVNEKC